MNKKDKSIKVKNLEELRGKVKPLDELIHEGWNNTFEYFKGLKIYRKDDARIFYNSLKQTIEYTDLVKED
jgi:hypothetical protein